MEGMESGGAAPPVAGADTSSPPPAAGGVSTAEMVNQLSKAMSAMNGATSGGAPPAMPIMPTNTAAAPDAPVNATKADFSKKKNESMTQLSPASYDGSSGDNALSSMFQGMASGATNQKNQAYNALNSLGGGANTGNLLGQQTEMINNLKSIEPILNTAEKFLDKFENSSISKMFQNMGGSIPGMSLLTGGGGNSGGNGLNPASIGS